MSTNEPGRFSANQLPVLPAAARFGRTARRLLLVAAAAATPTVAQAQWVPPIDVPDGTPTTPGVGHNTKDTMLRRGVRREVRATVTQLAQVYAIYEHYKELFALLVPSTDDLIDNMRAPGGGYSIDHMSYVLQDVGGLLPEGELMSFHTGNIFSGAVDRDALFAEVYVPDPSMDREQFTERRDKAGQQALAAAQATLLAAGRHIEDLEERNDEYLEPLIGLVRTALPRTRGLEEIQANLDAFIVQEYLLLEHALLLLGNLKATKGAYEASLDASVVMEAASDADAFGDTYVGVPVPAPPPRY
jgi:hypothetical protein